MISRQTESLKLNMEKRGRKPCKAELKVYRMGEIGNIDRLSWEGQRMDERDTGERERESKEHSPKEEPERYSLLGIRNHALQNATEHVNVAALVSEPRILPPLHFNCLSCSVCLGGRGRHERLRLKGVAFDKGDHWNKCLYRNEWYREGNTKVRTVVGRVASRHSLA